MIEKISISEYLDRHYSQAALYNCYRMIASYVDGLKPSSRKVVYTVRKKNSNAEEKVSRLAPSVAGGTEYLHGEANLQGVIVNMAQDFVGSNNEPLLLPVGNFGSRHVPIASSGRYIFVKKSDNLDVFFSKLDDKILIDQEFEGSIIEPKFLMPLIPLILVNGSEGMGTGYAQKILPRNIKDVAAAINDILLTGDTRRQLKPNYKGYRGKVQQGQSSNSWEIAGSFIRVNSTTIKITEVPIGYNLSSYLKVLNKLVDDRIIKSFDDQSDNDEFTFVVKATKEFVSRDDEDLMNTLKLVKRVSENYTCISENNEIIVFDSPKDILKAFVKVRLEYYDKRKKHMIEKITEEISFLNSTLAFIEGVISEDIKLGNVPKKMIEVQLDNIEEIVKKDNSYDYLLRMPLYSLTREKLVELKNKIKEKQKELNYYTRTTPEKLWESDLGELDGTRKK